MIMFFSRQFIYILFCIENDFTFLSLTQITNHVIFINTILQTKIDRSSFFSIQQIIAFVLSIIHTKVFTDKLCGRMHLYTQISTTYRI